MIFYKEVVGRFLNTLWQSKLLAHSFDRIGDFVERVDNLHANCISLMSFFALVNDFGDEEKLVGVWL